MPGTRLSTADGFSETSTSTKYISIYGIADSEGSPEYEVRTSEDPDTILAARGITPPPRVRTQWLRLRPQLEYLLDEKALEAGTAQVTLARKAFDHQTGRWVQPWQVLPGYLCRVAGAPAQNDAMNEHEPDGSAVFKIVSNDYSTSSASSRLELNAYTVDERRAVARYLAAQR